MKLWILSSSLVASLLILSGCGGTPKPASKDTLVIDKTLPKVTLTKHGVISGMKSIAFEWKSIKDPNVEGIYIYKMSPKEKGTLSELEYLTTIEGRYRTHFLDRDVEPETNYRYSFKTFSKKGESKPSKSVAVATLPVLNSVAWIYSITGLPRTAKIIWRPHENEIVKAYLIERKTLEQEEWERVATLHGRLNAEFIDEDLKDNYVYMYRVRVLTYNNIISKPSNVVKVVTKALPHPVKNIKTTTNLPHRIEISWTPSKAKEFHHYALYRSSTINGRYKQIATLYTNHYSDTIEENGKSYFYRVSCVDKDGLESENTQNSIQGMTLAPPAAPAITEAKVVGKNIELRWSQKDSRAVRYTVLKEQKKGWFDATTEEYKDIKKRYFIEKNVEADSIYSFVVYAFDKFGIKSEPSMEVKVVTPESTEIIAEVEKKSVAPVEGASKPVEVKVTKEVITPTEDLDLSGL